MNDFMGDDNRKKIRGQIESNDAGLVELTVSQANYYPLDGDWERDGKGIGRNTHIKELYFGTSFLDNAPQRAEFESFCEGFVGNKSIERLEIWCGQLFGGDIFNMLSPFFEQNHNLRCLKVGWGDGGTSNEKSGRLLSESLRRLNNLREFECSGGHLGENEVEALILLLAGHSGITRVSLCGNEVGGRALAALVAWLTNPNSSLVKLNLGGCCLDDERAVILAVALGGNSSLKELRLTRNENITTKGWTALFTQLQRPRSSLEYLRVGGGNPIDDAAANLLVNALVNNNLRLKVLNLAQCHNITTEGWEAVFDALRSPHCVLEEIHLLGTILMMTM